MAQQRRSYFAAAKGPDGDITVKVFWDRDAAEWEYGLLKWSDARKVRLGPVPAGIAKRADVAAVIRATLKDQRW